MICLLPLCTQLPLNVTLHNGVAPASIASLSTGLLLRLSVACYLGVPLADVILTAVTTTVGGVTDVVIEAGAGVNLQTGDCSQLDSDASASTPTVNVSAHGRRRTLDTSAATTTAFLDVRACRDASSSTGFSAKLQAQLLGLIASANASSAVLRPFLDAAARDSGVARGSLEPVIAVGSPSASAPTMAAQAAPTATGAGPSSAALVAAIAVSAVLLIVALCAFCLCIALRRRKRRRERERAKIPLESAAAAGSVGGVNPLHRSRKPFLIEVERDAVAPVPDALLLPDAVMLPWKRNPAFEQGLPTSQATPSNDGAGKSFPGTPRQTFLPRRAAGPASAAVGGPRPTDPFLGVNPLRGASRATMRVQQSPRPSLSMSAEDVRGLSPLRVAAGGATSPHGSPVLAAFAAENPLRKRAATPHSPLVSRGEVKVQLRSGSVVSDASTSRVFVAGGPVRSGLEIAGVNPLLLERAAAGSHDRYGSPAKSPAPALQSLPLSAIEGFSLDNPLRSGRTLAMALPLT